MTASIPPTATYSSSNDFRSDTFTTPTPSMFAAMAQASVGDDVYREDPTTSSFELYVASLVGHEAGCFTPSGTMSNQLGLRTHLLQPPHSVLCDHRAHVKNYEAGGLAALSQAMVIGVIPTNGLYLTLEDVQDHAILDDNIHFAQTKVISLENTLGGVIYPLEEVRRINQWAKENGIKMHLDGARLWNAVAAGAGSLLDYGACFDSISLCLSKGIGAPIGSILVASSAFIARARHIRKMLGGGMRQTGPLLAAARVALEENFPTQLIRTHEIAKKIEGALVGEMGLSTELPVDTCMLFVDLKKSGLKAEWITEEGKKRNVRIGAGRIVVHYQISDEAVDALIDTFRAVVARKKNGELALEDGKHVTPSFYPKSSN
ncbi:hypothetical protein DL93DRAFT_1671371 [Clavulina sp. PMI_390]|nr:hypothetical protein DL93DRAFT_1671371 [Clavulina sp. PMI_390]